MGLFDSLGSALGVAGSALVSPVFSAASGLLGSAFAKDRQEAANEFSAQQFATRYQTTVKDMQAAGLNPMLAYSQGGGTPPSSAIASANFPDVGSSLAQGQSAAMQTKINDAQVGLLEAQAMEAKASAWAKLDQSELMKSQVKEIQQKLENQYYANDVDRLKAVVKELGSQHLLNLERGMSEQQSRLLMQFQAGKLKSETDLLDFDIDAIKKMDNFGREYKQYAPIIDLIKAIFLPRGGGITINK